MKSAKRPGFPGQYRLSIATIAAGLATLISSHTLVAATAVSAGNQGSETDTAQPPVIAELRNFPATPAALDGYSLDPNGFQFNNAQLVDAVQRIHPDDWETLLTPPLMQLFGTQICMGEVSASGADCVLNANARNWLNNQLQLMEQGLCEGMAVGSLVLWQAAPENNASRLWPDRLAALMPRPTIQLPVDDGDMRVLLGNLAMLQGTDAVASATAAMRQQTPSEILQQLIEAMQSRSPDPYTMGIYRRDGEQLWEGHTLTPYRIEAGSTPGEYRVYVYDSNFPADQDISTYVTFDTVADTWLYQPTAEVEPFSGDSNSHNLDLTRLSWRIPTVKETPSYTGPFTCPFCSNPETQTVSIELIGEGDLSIYRYDDQTGDYTAAIQQAQEIPFKGGLDRQVPAALELPPDTSGKPFKVVLQGVNAAQTNTATLQITGTGYSAGVEDLLLSAEHSVVVYVLPTVSGPQITLMGNSVSQKPKLSVYLDDTAGDSVSFESANDAEYYLAQDPRLASVINVADYTGTERTASKSTSLTLTDLDLMPGKAVAIAVNIPQQRIYFGDQGGNQNQYELSIKNQVRLRDRASYENSDYQYSPSRTLTYDEETRVRSIDLAPNTQAFFDYGRVNLAPFEPGTRPYAEIKADLVQQLERPAEGDVNVVIGGSLGAGTASGPITLATTVATGTEVPFRGYLLKSRVR